MGFGCARLIAFRRFATVTCIKRGAVGWLEGLQATKPNPLLLDSDNKFHAGAIARLPGSLKTMAQGGEEPTLQ